MKQQHLDKSTTMITTTPMITKQTYTTAATPTTTTTTTAKTAATIYQPTKYQIMLHIKLHRMYLQLKFQKKLPNFCSTNGRGKEISN